VSESVEAEQQFGLGAPASASMALSHRNLRTREIRSLVFLLSPGGYFLGMDGSSTMPVSRSRKRLECFLDYPELELSNNLAENSMRGVALGRKNWIHIGSQQAGPRVAAILSVVESCRRLSIPVRDYLHEVLPGLANKSIQSLEQLTPAAYAASKLK
jgi:hypothetical protein